MTTTGSESLASLFAASPSLESSLPAIERAARSLAPVLIVGEPGTGRSSLARALHGASGRGDGPLVEVDPGALPSTLLESELFGHRAGAFTGAEQAEPGRVARAEGGTLVLDQIENLPLASQPKLLRLLAERRYAPLGGKERVADVRFVAIAAEGLEDRVQQGVFRADLFFRLEVLTYRLSPLRERLADIPSLIPALLRDLTARLGRSLLEVDGASLTWMARYPWPGNLRQLRNLLERALIHHRGDGPLSVDPPEDADAGRPSTLLETERREILKALAYTRGHQGRAAELLGISRKALWEKRRRHDLP